MPQDSRRTFLQRSALLTASTYLMPEGLLDEVAVASGPKLPGASDARPVFPYGGVYFRKTNPPATEWERDHKTAARLGANVFRHWFVWSAIEVSPGKYDWSDYDRLMDIAAASGIRVVIAEITGAAPEWAFHQYPNARLLASDGTVARSIVWESDEVGGLPGLCFDNPEIRELAERFLAALVERYRDHPATFAYDVWNENTFIGGAARHMYCYCDASKQRMRNWLQKRYGTLEETGKRWHRYSYRTWEDVDPPVSFSGYADSLDWLQFRIDNAFDLFDWRLNLIRKLDPHHLVTAHGIAGTLEDLPYASHNEWESAKRVDVFGLTWIAARKGDEPWKQFQAMDLVRCGSRGKPFWHAEAQGGPLWMQSQVIGRPRTDGRIPSADDVRLWNLVSFAAGAKGLMYCRWRPLLDGPLFGAFGPMGMDGSVTPEAEMAGKIARWTNSHPDLWRSNTVRGDVGLLFVPESEIFDYVQRENTTFYSNSIRGAYQAFFASNIQPDFVALENVDEYRLIYLPFPIMLTAETVKKLRNYVEKGGTLVCEGLPAYFGDHGHVGEVQPNLGLDELFGARQSYVEFVPDIEGDLKFKVKGKTIFGSYFRQNYMLNGGRDVGNYEDGTVAAVEHTFGRGRTLLLGSFPGAGYFNHHSKETQELFADFLDLAGVQQAVRTDDLALTARIHQGAGGTYLWVVNPSHQDRSAKITMAAEYGTFSKGDDIWLNRSSTVVGSDVNVAVGARNASVIRLR